MRDIPFFTCGGGAATLILREIPYKKAAYVLPRSVDPERQTAFWEECRGFCRAAGAQRVVLISREETPLPLLWELVRLQRPAGAPELPKAPDGLVLERVTQETIPVYRAVYESIFAGVLGAASRPEDEGEDLRSGGAFLAKAGGEPAGVGRIRGREILCLGLLLPFRGRGLGAALLSRLLEETGPEAYLEAASDNGPAMGLSEKLGFVRVDQLSFWYDLDAPFKTE